MKNLYIQKQGRKAISVQVNVMRDGVRRTRRFLVTKFGGLETAIARATEYARYLRLHASPTQFRKALRRVGRPLKTELFGRRIVRN